jgi:hypothetical protein
MMGLAGNGTVLSGGGGRHLSAECGRIALQCLRQSSITALASVREKKTSPSGSSSRSRASNDST